MDTYPLISQEISTEMGIIARMVEKTMKER
jgi:hypothetical protein